MRHMHHMHHMYHMRHMMHMMHMTLKYDISQFCRSWCLNDRLNFSNHTSRSNSTLRLRDYFQNLSKTIPGGRMGRGANSTVTPTKRKLIENKKVALLVPVFSSENTPVISPTESESMFASPAKRQKMETGVKHPSSQPPKSANYGIIFCIYRLILYWQPLL